MTTSPICLKRLGLELFVLSLSSLFFELLVIRWLGCSFHCFAVFKSFPLVTCFVGLGVGVSRGDDRPFKYTAAAILLFAVITQWLNNLGLGDMLFPSIGIYQWGFLDAFKTPLIVLNLVLMMLGIFLLLAGPFAVMYCLGSRIGFLFNQQKPLIAYSIDISGAITGSIIFGVLSFLCMPPWVELVILSLLIIFFVKQNLRRLAMSFGAIGLAGVISWAPFLNHGHAIWSPYNRIDRSEIILSPEVTGRKEPEDFGFYLYVNQLFMQAFTKTYQLPPLNVKAITPIVKDLQRILPVREAYYGLPYKLIKPKEVLVLGAGSGSDVKEALSQGAEHVDAVEIDPSIISIGKSLNPAYHSDRVNIYCDDARDYVNHADKKYDLIVFACLDSFALVGLGSSVRMDSYIHTKECYQKCLSLLKQSGILVLSFGSGPTQKSHWLRDRIYVTLSEASGYPPLAISDEDASPRWGAYVFVAGEPVRRGVLKAPKIANSFTAASMPSIVTEHLLTDDWPCLYVKSNQLDLTYFAVVVEVLAICAYFGRGLLLAKKSNRDWQLFLLGAAFILIELQAISRLSLLFGATWVTSSIVINGILVMILAANFTVLLWQRLASAKLYYMLLFVTLLISYFLPIHELLAWDGLNGLAGRGITAFFTLLPMFMAGMIFAISFNQTDTPARSLGFNLLGSVIGCLLEYAAIYSGVKSLILIATALYALSAAFFFSSQPDQTSESADEGKATAEDS
jgi:hypothetical protein